MCCCYGEAGVTCYTGQRADGQGQGGSVGKACARRQKKSGIAAATALPYHASLMPCSALHASTARQQHSRANPSLRSLHSTVRLPQRTPFATSFHKSTFFLPRTKHLHKRLSVKAIPPTARVSILSPPSHPIRHSSPRQVILFSTPPTDHRVGRRIKAFHYGKCSLSLVALALGEVRGVRCVLVARWQNGATKRR